MLKNIYCIIPILLLLFQLQETNCRQERVKRSNNIHFIVKHALIECKIPSNCQQNIHSALINHKQIPHCEDFDYFELLKCLDNEILPRTNLTNLNSKSGQVCCNIERASLTCQMACKSALFAPTLSHEQKKNRIEIICHKEHGNEFQGDKGLVNCLATANEWMLQRN
uniref:CPG4 domain-containing protein n=1 Tax=Meloidogyne hapla TaxID=6305 RepID=A0A1I8B699_MELHA